MPGDALIHLDRHGTALCGALHATLLDTRPAYVTCLACDGMARMETFVLATVGNLAIAAQRKLTELQRNPKAQALGQFARLLIRADIETRARAAGR